jgi:hypothetical protein
VWGFVVDKVALAQVFSEHCSLILSVVIHQSSVILMTDNGPIEAALPL